MDAIDKVGPDRKKVRAELNRTKDYDSVVGKITFDDHRQNAVPIITRFVVQDGKWVVWEDSEYASGKRALVKK
jgi:branched-chain amino acid transport system substrate-binding protein